jgi:hypothetical protein
MNKFNGSAHLINPNPAFGHNLASGPAFGHNMASGLAFGHNLALGLVSGHNMTSGPASGHNLAFGLASGHNTAFGPAFGHNMAFGPAFGRNMASLWDSVHNMVSLWDSGRNMASLWDSRRNMVSLWDFGCNMGSLRDSSHNMASLRDSGRNMALGPAFGHNMAFGPAFGHNMAFGPAFGCNTAFNQAFDHNMVFASAFGYNMAFGPAFGHNAAFGPAFGHNKLIITAFGHSKLIKLIGPVGHTNSLVGLGCFSDWLACVRKKMWYSDHNDVFPYCHAAAMQAAATHLELGVATSANKISNVLALYFCATSLYYIYWLVRESWLWHVLCRLNSFFFGDTLQNAKQLFSLRLPKMMKYCVMRECENILCGYLYDGDLVFVILKGISILNSSKGFWRSLPEISLLLLLLFFFSLFKDLITNPLMPFPFALAWLNAFQAVRHSHNMGSLQIHTAPTPCVVFCRTTTLLSLTHRELSVT